MGPRLFFFFCLFWFSRQFEDYPEGLFRLQLVFDVVEPSIPNQRVFKTAALINVATNQRYAQASVISVQSKLLRMDIFIADIIIPLCYNNRYCERVSCTWP